MGQRTCSNCLRELHPTERGCATCEEMGYRVGTSPSVGALPSAQEKLFHDLNARPSPEYRLAQQRRYALEEFRRRQEAESARMAPYLAKIEKEDRAVEVHTPYPRFTRAVRYQLNYDAEVCIFEFLDFAEANQMRLVNRRFYDHVDMSRGYRLPGLEAKAFFQEFVCPPFMKVVSQKCFNLFSVDNSTLDPCNIIDFFTFLHKRRQLHAFPSDLFCRINGCVGCDIWPEWDNKATIIQKIYQLQSNPSGEVFFGQGDKSSGALKTLLVPQEIKVRATFTWQIVVYYSGFPHQNDYLLLLLETGNLGLYDQEKKQLKSNRAVENLVSAGKKIVSICHRKLGSSQSLFNGHQLLNFGGNQVAIFFDSGDILVLNLRDFCYP